MQIPRRVGVRFGGSILNATTSELEQFEHNRDDFVSSALRAGVVTLAVGDRIKVVSGPLYSE
jgi:hypothetical protein